MQSYQFPLPDAHGSLVAFLLQLGRKVGLAGPAAASDRMSRRHRMMLVVDERRACARERSNHAPGLIPPAASALSKPTYFGSFCSSLVAPRQGGHEQTLAHERERRRRDMRIAARLLNAQRHLNLEQQHRDRVRGYGLDDSEATTTIGARQRQIALLQRLGQIAE
jgi:hypothetical protein